MNNQKESFEEIYIKNKSAIFSIENDSIKLDERKLSNNSLIIVNVINIEKEEIEILGKIRGIGAMLNLKFYYEINGIEKKLNCIKSSYFNKKIGDKNYEEFYSFSIKEKIEKNSKIKFYYKKDKNKATIYPRFTEKSKLNNKFNLKYNKDGLTVYLSNKEINIVKNNHKPNLKLICQLIKRRKIKIILIRLLAKFNLLLKKHKIWLISDRTQVANDNGLHFFKYVNKVGNPQIKSYFVISKDSKDYNEVKKYGEVVPYNSLKYKLLFLISDKIISSQADEWVTNAFGKVESYYRDMYTFDFVFLQHGIIKDDMSSWLNKTNKNIDIFVTSVKREHDSLLECDYGYTTDQVKMTGLPRYDNLKNNQEKLIAIMPTWRKNISGEVDELMGSRKYTDSFKKTEYFKFYNSLINDKKLLEIMNSKGYKGIFVVHPSNMPNFKDFQGNDTFSIVEGFADYQDIFSRAALLVTDFSSVAFDFGYLKKPIIYSQFDEKKFFNEHLYTKGYFDYRKDGFGPVLNTKDSIIEEIDKVLSADCKIEKKYKNRIESFFSFNDSNNCKRLYDIISKN